MSKKDSIKRTAVQQMSAHDKLVKQAYKAIDNLFSDTSVDIEETREDLQDLRADIDIKIESLKYHD
jgi:hypothetical protein